MDKELLLNLNPHPYVHVFLEWGALTDVATGKALDQYAWYFDVLIA